MTAADPAPRPAMLERARQPAIRVFAVALSLFTLAEVNYPQLRPLTQLAVFAFLGLGIAFLAFPLAERFRKARWASWLDFGLVAATAAVFGYVAVQSEPAFEALWSAGRSLGDRAGAETALDFAVGIAGLALVVEAARRTVGPALPLLSLAFVAYALWGAALPGWLFPHRGYGLERIVAQTFLHSQGVFGVALRVMFTYVFLFVVFGALLEATGATRFVIDFTRRLFRASAGAPAKVAVLASGLMGSLSGSAVANTATTGTFTIPLMRSAGFRPHVAAAVEAAASSGGALVPPVMGAGAYMMLEIVEPPVTYVEILKAAILPAVLYYFSLFLIVHFEARRTAAGDAGDAETGTGNEAEAEARELEARELEARGGEPPGRFEGLVFAVALGMLLAFLLAGFTVFRSVTLAMVATLVLSAFRARTRLGPRRLTAALERAARGGVALVAAAAAVGVVLGVVTLTGVGSKLPATILPLAEGNLTLALLLIMGSSIVLGMGLPSAVCYLLLATLIGPALGGLGVVPLAAHLFIFYFGLMSMVTPPVALAAYTAASIAGSPILRTSFSAFRYALVGFVLPFLFVYRPQLLMLTPAGGPAPVHEIALAFGIAALAIWPLAAAITGYLGRPLGPLGRALLVVASLALLDPGDYGYFPGLPMSITNLGGAALLAAIGLFERRRRPA